MYQTGMLILTPVDTICNEFFSTFLIEKWKSWCQHVKKIKEDASMDSFVISPQEDNSDSELYSEVQVIMFLVI